MNKDFNLLRLEMDSWVKAFNSKVNNLSYLPHLLRDHTDNIDHNYELLQQMRSEIQKLKEELATIRMVQLLHLKADIKKN